MLENEVNEMMNWITKDMLLKKQYETFTKIRESCPSCKPYIRQDNMNYEDCMLQKWNYAYEKTLDIYKNT